MILEQYIIRRKLNIIELAEQLGNISEACRKLGVSHQHYYDIKKALEEGIEGLLEKARNKPRIANPMETFKDGLDLCKQYLHNREEVIKEVA